MPAIPPTSDFNKSTIDKDTFHAKFLELHAYLTGLLASSGNAADARSQLGLGSAATVNTGTASGNVPLVGTESATTTVAGLVLKSTTTENAAGTGTGVVAAADLPTAVAALAPAGFGEGQTWQNVLASRASTTVYQNTTGKPIYVAVSARNDAVEVTAHVEAANPPTVVVAYMADAANAGNSRAQITFVVPNNHYYSVTAGGVIQYWAELR